MWHKAHQHLPVFETDKFLSRHHLITSRSVPFQYSVQSFAQEIPVTEHHIPAPARAKFQLRPVTLALPVGKTLRSGFIILNWKIKPLSNTTLTSP